MNAPARLLLKRIWLPSGDQAGPASNPVPVVIRTWPDPSAFIT
jgi:hypothetical protein